MAPSLIPDDANTGFRPGPERKYQETRGQADTAGRAPLDVTQPRSGQVTHTEPPSRSVTHSQTHFHVCYNNVTTSPLSIRTLDYP